MSMNQYLKPFIPICDALAALFEPHVEVVLHDLKSKRLAYIANAFSSRRAGDPMVGAEQKSDKEWVGPYLKNQENRQIKAVTIILRNIDDEPIGMMCVNYDISAVKGLHEALLQFVNLPKTKEPNAFFAQNWKAHIDERIESFLHAKRATLQGLTQQEKRDLVKELESQGIFEIRNGVSYVASVLKISRASLYNWLKKERNI